MPWSARNWPKPVSLDPPDCKYPFGTNPLIKCVPVPLTGTWASIEAVAVTVLVAVLIAFFAIALPSPLKLKPPPFFLEADFKVCNVSTCWSKAWFFKNLKPGLLANILVIRFKSSIRAFTWLCLWSGSS